MASALSSEHLAAFEKRAAEAERLIEVLKQQIADVKQNQKKGAAAGAVPGDYKELFLEGLAEIEASALQDQRKIETLTERNAELETENRKLEYRITHLLRSLEAAEKQAEAVGEKKAAVEEDKS